MALQLLARQISATAIYGCQYDITAVESCAYSAERYPTCANFRADKACCSNWLSWEYSYIGCLQTAYKNCYDFQGYASEISAFLPCYTDAPLTAPASAQAQATTTPVPSLVLQSISTAGPTTRPPHDPLPSYSGTGGLLKDYCSTPDFVLLDGPTAYWAPVVGCINDKADCCPYATAPKTTTGPTPTTITVVSTVTVEVDPSGQTNQPVLLGNNPYPLPLSANQATLARCPDDYVVVGTGCCPSGYSLWNAPLGGEVPCYSSLKATIDPPPVPVISLSSSSLSLTGSLRKTTSTSESTQKPTSAIVNIVYAVQYAVKPSSSSGGLSTGAKAGIGIGAALISIGLIGLAGFFFWRYRKNKKNSTAIATGQAPPTFAQAPPTYPPPQGQYGSFQPMQQPQGVPVAGYYAQKETEPQVTQMPAQSPVGYPSPPSSTVSPANGYGYQNYQGQQAAYFPQGQGPPTSYAPSSATSELPSSQHGYVVPSQPVSSTGSPPPSEVHGHTITRRAVAGPTQGPPAFAGGPSAPIQELSEQHYAEVGGHTRPGEMP